MNQNVENKKYEQYEIYLLYKFLKVNLFDLLGIPNSIKDNFKLDNNKCNDPISNYAEVVGDKTLFGFKNNRIAAFSIDYKITESNCNWCAKIIEAFLNVVNANKSLFNQNSLLAYFYDSTEKNHDYIALSESYTSKFEKQLFDFAIERGIINWAIPSHPDSILRMERLFAILEEWSTKTYEGHNVCFGLLINTENNTKPVFQQDGYSNSFLDFLSDEYSATLSDGISSLLEIDTSGNFIKYISLTENNIIKQCDINESTLPYRFSQIIISNVISQKLGIFLLQNGDIILAKEQKIIFIKRNGKWLNFQYSSFETIIKNKTGFSEESFNKLLRNCFATCIDVSLAHTGGIISVVSPDRIDDLKNICSDIDTFITDKTEEELYYGEIEKQLNFECAIKNSNDNLMSEFKKVYRDEYKKRLKDIQKRLTKRKIVKNLISLEDTLINYSDIDRKLRTELTGLDGASIIDTNGNVISFGAIIKNDAGSSGGGRGAAAKALSKYGGFAIKISTDGYIEVYYDGNRIYSIK